MSNFTEEQIKKGQEKYEADSLPINISYIAIIIIVLLALLSDNF
jgi:hypothetical protein